MGVHSIAISLSATRTTDGAPISRSDFIDRLQISSEAPIAGLVCTGAASAMSRVDFLPVRAKDHPFDTPGVVPFDQAVEDRLLQIASFLDAQPADSFLDIEALGICAYVYVDVWMDQDQFELSLSPKLLASCARLGLRIELISNDISADQARAWGAT